MCVCGVVCAVVCGLFGVCSGSVRACTMDVWVYSVSWCVCGGGGGVRCEVVAGGGGCRRALMRKESDSWPSLVRCPHGKYPDW